VTATLIKIACLRLSRKYLSGAGTRDSPFTRLTAHAEWIAEDWPGSHDFIEYQSRLNYILPRHRDAVICQCKLSKFDAKYAMDVMRTHPVIIIGGIVQENPFYLPPDEFQRELRKRDVKNELNGAAK
jgi:hypothetical protein